MEDIWEPGSKLQPRAIRVESSTVLLKDGVVNAFLGVTTQAWSIYTMTDRLQVLCLAMMTIVQVEDLWDAGEELDVSEELPVFVTVIESLAGTLLGE